jgi:hypothetical protein
MGLSVFSASSVLHGTVSRTWKGVCAGAWPDRETKWQLTSQGGARGWSGCRLLTLTNKKKIGAYLEKDAAVAAPATAEGGGSWSRPGRLLGSAVSVPDACDSTRGGLLFVIPLDPHSAA